MTERIPQSTSYLVVFKAYLASDHVSEATSKTIAITISKNGGAFGNPNAGATNATEISSGWYKVTLDTTDTGTLGPLALRGAVATIDDVGVLLTVVAATNGGLTALPAVASGSAGGVLIQGTGTTGLSVSSGVANANVTSWNGTTVHTPDTAGYPVVTIKDGTGAGEIDLANGSIVDVFSSGLSVSTFVNLIQAIWDIQTTDAAVTPGSVGELLTTNVNATISSRLASASISLSGGAVTVGTNNDKTGYALSQTFPSNFSALAISAGGVASADVKAVKGTTVTGSGTSGDPWGP